MDIKGGQHTGLTHGFDVRGEGNTGRGSGFYNCQAPLTEEGKSKSESGFKGGGGGELRAQCCACYVWLAWETAA